jgi:hypothetical protein
MMSILNLVRQSWMSIRIKNLLCFMFVEEIANLTDPRGFKWSYTQCGDQHPTQTVDYYERALAEFDDNQPVFVFSDSIEWVKEQEFFSGDRFLLSEPVDKYADGSFTPYADLCLMSCVLMLLLLIVV